VAEEARAQGFAPPAIVVIGDIVTAREKLREIASGGTPR
jgi:siroheme synthase